MTLCVLAPLRLCVNFHTVFETASLFAKVNALSISARLIELVFEFQSNELRVAIDHGRAIFHFLFFELFQFFVFGFVFVRVFVLGTFLSFQYVTLGSNLTSSRVNGFEDRILEVCLLYTSPSPRDS